MHGKQEPVVRLTSDDVRQRMTKARAEMTRLLLENQDIKRVRKGNNPLGTQVALDWLLQIWEEVHPEHKALMAKTFTTSVYNYPFSKALNPGSWTRERQAADA